jgi:hypothetical protein
MGCMTDKRTALKEISDKLLKLMPHLGNENAGERENAVQMINNLLRSAGLDWHDLGALLINGGEEDGDGLADLFANLLGADDEKVIALAHKTAFFFHNGAGGVFADVNDDGRRLTYSLDGDDFADWLRYLFFKQFRKPLKESPLKTALATLRAQAKYEGDRLDVHIRAARVDSVIENNRGKNRAHIDGPEHTASAQSPDLEQKSVRRGQQRPRPGVRQRQHNHARS